jgi:hypothetical protein
MKRDFANNADLQAARATRMANDVRTLSATWNRNELLEHTLSALNGLRGKGYQFEVEPVKYTAPDQTGETYAAPALIRTIRVTAGKNLVKSGKISTMNLTLDLDGRYSFDCDTGLAPRMEHTTISNLALNTVQAWLLDVQQKYNIQCMSDLSRQMARVEADKAKAAQKIPNPKAA